MKTDSIYKTKVRKTKEMNPILITKIEYRTLKRELLERGIEVNSVAKTVIHIMRYDDKYEDADSIYREMDRTYYPLEVSIPLLIECNAREKDVIALHKEILKQAGKKSELNEKEYHDPCDGMSDEEKEEFYRRTEETNKKKEKERLIKECEEGIKEEEELLRKNREEFPYMYEDIEDGCRITTYRLEDLKKKLKELKSGEE